MTFYVKMDETPLIPKSSNVVNIDVAPIIGEVFQNAIEPKFDKRLAENIDTFAVENQNLKDSSAKVLCAYNEAKLSMEGIGVVENSLMVRQAACMNEKYYLDQDKIVTEHLKLKRRQILLDFYEPETAKYGLVRKEDFLPIRPERAIDFRLNSNRHLCEKCPSTASTRSLAKKASLIPIKIPALKKVISEEVFRAEPPEICFLNFRLDVTYEVKHRACEACAWSAEIIG